VLLAMILATACEVSPGQTEAARVAPRSTETPVDPASAAAAVADARAARGAMALDPTAETPVLNLIDALVRAGRKQDALAEADRFIKRGKATAVIRAQRGFLRRQLNDVRGAVEDLTAALAGEGLNPDQRSNVHAGLAEAHAADAQARFERAQQDLAQGNFADAAEGARLVLLANPASEPAMRIRIEGLSGARKKREALAEADQFMLRVSENTLLRAQRGYLRRELNDLRGASEDFAAALASGRLTPEQRRNLEAALAETRIAETQGDLGRAEAVLQGRDYTAALEASRVALEREPDSEPAMRIRIEALSRTGRSRDALTEADRFIGAHAATALLVAQRGYLRRELGNTTGAIDDFKAALAGTGLSTEQRQNVQAALTEAQVAIVQANLAEEAARAERDQKLAPKIADAPPAREAKVDPDRVIAQGGAAGWVYAQRGFARRKADNFQGAVDDFDAAIKRGDLDRRSIPDIRYARAEAAAMLAERDGNTQQAEASYRELLEKDPARADAWFKLGYLLLKQNRRAQGAEALHRGLQIRPVGAAYLDAANAYILTNAPRASKLYREGLDRWYAGDPSLAGRSEIDLERVKNEVVEADATIRTSLGASTIMGRPLSAGGTNNAFGAETVVRFDDRYLPAIAGLEAVVRGLSGKDSNGLRETDVGIGLRYRPIRDLNLYFGGVVDYFFEPTARPEFVVNWGLGLGSDPYPYRAGWKPYWDFGTFGAWRTSEGRLLEDTRLNLGYLYEFRSPVRAAIGPTILAVAGYDNLAASPWAAGIGPSLLSYFWLGGDKYRSYDYVLTMQVGYLFNIGNDERQRGWRGRVGVTF